MKLKELTEKQKDELIEKYQKLVFGDDKKFGLDMCYDNYYDFRKGFEDINEFYEKEEEKIDGSYY